MKKTIITIMMFMVMMVGVSANQLTIWGNEQNILEFVIGGGADKYYEPVDKGYVAAVITVNPGCTLTGYDLCEYVLPYDLAGGGYQDCSGLDIWVSVTDSEIRLVSSVQSSQLPSNYKISLQGSGSCTISSGQSVDSYFRTGEAVSLGGVEASYISENNQLSFSCPLPGDTPPSCDGIDRTELGTVAQQWINTNGADNDLRIDLGLAAQDWIDAGGPA